MSYEFDFDELDRRTPGGGYQGINPIKLKAMAMKLRHRAQGYKFHNQVSWSQRESLEAPLTANADTASQASGVPEDVLAVDGPNNMLGLWGIFYHPFCVPLVCIPLGIVSYVWEWGDVTTFWLNFLALVPLAKILGDATEELAASLRSDTISGLLNATFGNAVELIISIQSIRRGLLTVVKASLLGSVLSNTLLVLGSSFLLGGLSPSKTRRGRFHSFHDGSSDSAAVQAQFEARFGIEKEQKFPVKGALISMGMLLFSCMSFALPTIFNALPTNDADSVLQVSRIGAWIVMSCYVAFLIFQLHTHRTTLAKSEQNPGGLLSDEEIFDDEEEEPSLTATCALGLMAACTVVTSVNSELMVASIEPVVQRCGMPVGFIGVILIPIAGNACEHAAALRFAFQDRPGLSIGIAVGSATQVALLVLPFSVVVASFMDQPMDLDVGTLNVAVVTLSMLVVLTLLMDGRSNWLKGYILVALYVFIAVLYWYMPHGFSSAGYDDPHSSLLEL